MWENLPICLFVADVDKFTKLWVCHRWKEIYPTEFLQMGKIYPNCQCILHRGFLSLWVCHRWGKVCPSVSLSRKGENFLSCEIVKDGRGSISWVFKVGENLGKICLFVSLSRPHWGTESVATSSFKIPVTIYTYILLFRLWRKILRNINPHRIFVCRFYTTRESKTWLFKKFLRRNRSLKTIFTPFLHESASANCFSSFLGANTRKRKKTASKKLFLGELYTPMKRGN